MADEAGQDAAQIPGPPSEGASPAGAAEGELEEAGDEVPGSFAEWMKSNDIVKAYEDACQEAGRKVNFLVRRSLHESVQAERSTWFVEAPGNHKITFSCRVHDEDMAVFAKAFMAPAVYLQRLDLSYNVLTDAGAAALAGSLLSADRARSLSALSLRSNSIGPDGCFDICQALVMCPSLRRFDISHNPLGREGGLLVVDLLRNSPDLSELHLQDTEADIDVIVAIADALLNPELTLKVCNIENARIETLQEDHTVHLGRMLRVNRHLSEIYLGKIKMRDEGARQLVSFLLENKTLRVLDLRCNEIGAEGARHLGVLLASDCQLSHLNLCANRIGEKDNVEGAAAIARALTNNRMLRHLDLNHNTLCGAALKAIADAIDQNSMLESIALFHNNWDQPSSYKFHQILNDRARVLPLKTDLTTSEVDFHIDVCQVDNFQASGR